MAFAACLPHCAGGGLFVPLWIPLCALLVLTVTLARGMRRTKPGHCLRCGYDLTGNVSGRCPECGHRISTAQGRARD